MKLKLTTYKDLKSKKSADLDKYITDTKKQLSELTHLISTNKDKQTHQVKQLKRVVAQAKTIKRQQELGKEQ